MSQDTKRVLITALVGLLLAAGVMGFEIWKGYSACVEGGLDSYVVKAMWFEIFTYAKSGAEYVGTPQIINMLFVAIVYIVVLVSVSELSRQPQKK